MHVLKRLKDDFISVFSRIKTIEINGCEEHVEKEFTEADEIDSR